MDELPRKIVQRRLTWFGHIERRQPEHLLWKVSEMEVEGKRRRGCPKRRWCDCVNGDMESLGITITLALDRTAWKANLHKERPHTQVGQARVKEEEEEDKRSENLTFLWCAIVKQSTFVSFSCVLARPIVRLDALLCHQPGC